MACKAAFIHHTCGKQYYQALFVYRTDLGQNLLFLPYLNLQFSRFSQFNKKNCICLIIRTIKARVIPCTTSYRIENI